MAPSAFTLVLQHGANSSGFAGDSVAPQPSATFNLSKVHDQSHILIQSSKASNCELSASASEPLSKELPLSEKDTESLVDEVYNILKEIPTESPPNSEDIYGLDTIIFWGSAEFQWKNGGPSKREGGNSEVQPTDEQKDQFKRAVNIVEELVKRGDEHAAQS